MQAHLRVWQVICENLGEPAIRRLAGDRSGSQISLCPKSEKARNFTNKIAVNVSNLTQKYPTFLKK